jgi:hypothetical protein
MKSSYVYIADSRDTGLSEVEEPEFRTRFT